MAKNTHRDTIDCLLCELKDAYEVLKESDYARNEVEIAEATSAARASIERAYQLVSDLKAQES